MAKQKVEIEAAEPVDFSAPGEETAAEDFAPPPAKAPIAKAPTAAVTGQDWPDIPGDPAAPIFCDFAPFMGWCGGGPVATALCQPNDITGAPGCRNYNRGLDSCNSSVPNSLRGKMLACHEYKPAD